MMQSVHEKIEKEKEVELGARALEAVIKEGGETIEDCEEREEEEEEQSDFEEDKVAEAKQHWRSFAETLVRQRVCLVVEPRSEASLADAIKDTKICSTDEGGQDKRRAFIYDAKTVGESKTAPHIRYPPHKCNHMMKMIQGALKSRQEDPSEPLKIAANDCHIFIMWLLLCGKRCASWSSPGRRHPRRTRSRTQKYAALMRAARISAVPSFMMRRPSASQKPPHTSGIHHTSATT